MNAENADMQNGWRVVAAAGATVTTLAVGGCGTFEAPAAVPACAKSESDTSPHIAKLAAQTCLKGRAGLIALVGYGTGPEQLSAEADAIKVAVKSSTGGLVNVTVVPIAASPESQDALHESTQLSGCVDKNNLAAEIANEEQGLGKYAAVVALTTLKSCVNGISGMANSLPGRYADVYNVSANSKIAPIAYVATHELLHIYGLGHHGEVIFPNDASPQTLEKKHMTPSGALDMNTFLAQCRFAEYSNAATSPRDVQGMGFEYEHTKPENNYLSPDQATLTPIQRDMLRWPELVLDKNAPVKNHHIVDGTVNYSPIEYKNGEFATIDLATPITLTNKSEAEGAAAHTYNKVAFLPGIVLTQNAMGIVEYEPPYIYLINADGASVTKLLSLEIYRHQTFIFGDKLVRTHQDENGFSLTIEAAK